MLKNINKELLTQVGKNGASIAITILAAIAQEKAFNDKVNKIVDKRLAEEIANLKK